MLSLKGYDSAGRIFASAFGDDEVSLPVAREYREGDRLLLEVAEPCHVHLQFDEVLGSSLCYVTGNTEYPIPFGQGRVNLSPKAFAGDLHLLKARLARSDELLNLRNLALNANDSAEAVYCFPHASASVETRGEAVFAARNAINGNTLNTGHGMYPYESWGINRDPDACFRLDFGRPVEIERLVLYTRADFPHDNWWKEAELAFSDGESLRLSLTKSVLPQVFALEKRTISWLTLSKLIQSDFPSPFPALSQIEVYGRDLTGA